MATRTMNTAIIDVKPVVKRTSGRYANRGLTRDMSFAKNVQLASRVGDQKVQSPKGFTVRVTLGLQAGRPFKMVDRGGTSSLYFESIAAR